jgi:hypothetical protein
MATDGEINRKKKTLSSKVIHILNGILCNGEITRK